VLNKTNDLAKGQGEYFNILTENPTHFNSILTDMIIANLLIMNPWVSLVRGIQALIMAKINHFWLQQDKVHHMIFF
jgi:hypothetical protein